MIANSADVHSFILALNVRSVNVKITGCVTEMLVSVKMDIQVFKICEIFHYFSPIQAVFLSQRSNPS